MKTGGKRSALLRRFIGNAGWSVASEALGKAVIFAVSIYLARVLSVEGFGSFSYAQALTMYFWLAVGFGIGMYGIREVARNREDPSAVISQLVTIRAVAAVVVFILYIIAALLLSTGEPEARRQYLASGLFLLSFAAYPDWALRGLERFRQIFIGYLLTVSYMVIGTLYLVRGGDDVASALFIWATSYGAGSLALYYYLARIGIRVRLVTDRAVMMGHIRNSIYFTISGIYRTIFQYIPIFVIGMLYTNYEVGVLAAPYKVVITLNHAGALIMIAAFPILSDLYKKDYKTFRYMQGKLFVLMCVLGLGVLVLGTMFASWLVEFLFTSSYVESVPVFKALLWVLPLSLIRNVFGPTLQTSGNERLHSRSTFLGLMALAICIYPLVQNMGALGGAYSLVVAEAAVVAAMIFYDFATKRDRVTA